MSAQIAELFRILLLTVGALFPIVNPLGNAPIFLLLTRDFSSGLREVFSRKIALNSFVLLVVSILIGTHILAFFGISLPVVQVGGGLLVIANGWSLLNRRDHEEAKHRKENPPNPVDVSSRAFYPLTLPLTVGPGSISVAITVGANRPQAAEFAWTTWAAELLGPAIIALTIYLSYRFAERLGRALGDAGMNVVLRLSSFILVCIGVQIVWNGVSALVHSLALAQP
ncbi:MAG TPA: MarC family protein [Bryobacteraceae bacterium]|nr:MarC family protein [Bryobacteraceae bacterium]